MNTLLWCFTGLLGLVIGSFLNVCIDRVPEKKSLLRPPSHCDSCDRRLTIPDLVPVFSYLILKGQCRHCGAAIPLRVMLVELFTGILFAFLYWHYGFTWQLVVGIWYTCIFLVLLVIDLERQILPNRIIYPAIAAALIIDGVTKQPDIVNGLIGGAAGFGLLLIPFLLTRGRGMGDGDVQMAFLIGLVTGFPLIFVALLAAIVLGGIISVVLILAGVKKRKESIPFGPFLSIGTVLTFLYGAEALQWYLRFF